MTPENTKKHPPVISLKGKMWILAAVAVLILIACAAQLSYLIGHDPRDEARKASPEPAADPVVPFLQAHRLLGRIVLMQFGGIGSASSEQGLELMMALHNRKTIPDLLYARVETSENAGEVDAYYAEKQLPFPVFDDENASVARAFGVGDAETAFVLIDRFGHIRYRGSQPDRFDLYNWVDALKQETADPGPEVALFGAETLDIPRLLNSTRLPDLARAVEPLRSYRGDQGLLLIFVDTTCPFAGTAIGEIPAVAAVLAARRIRSVVVNLNDSERDVLAFYRTRRLGVPIVYDTGTGTQLRWKVDTVPTVMLLNQADEIMYGGPAVWADVAAAAADMLGLPSNRIVLGVQGTGEG